MSETETVVEKKEEIKDSESSADVAESAQKSEAVTETVEEVKTQTNMAHSKHPFDPAQDGTR